MPSFTPAPFKLHCMAGNVCAKRTILTRDPKIFNVTVLVCNLAKW